MNIFGIMNAIRDKLENLQVDEQTGEVLNFDEIEALEAEKSEKIETILCYCLDLKAEETAIKERAKELTARANSLAKKRERLMKYISTVLNGEKFKTDKIKVSWRKSETTEIEADKKSELVAWLMEHHPEMLTCKEPEPQKDALNKAIKDGEEIPYVAIVEHNNMSVK